MKRIGLKKAATLFLCLSLASFSLFGCSKSKAASDSDAEKSSEKTLRIELPGNPTTGFTWVCSVSDESILKEINESYVSSNAGKNLVGAGGRFIFEFEGINEGEVTLTFNYLRTFQENSTIKTAEYRIAVDKDGNISFLSESGIIES